MNWLDELDRYRSEAEAAQKHHGEMLAVGGERDIHLAAEDSEAKFAAYSTYLHGVAPDLIEIARRARALRDNDGNKGHWGLLKALVRALEGK